MSGDRELVGFLHGYDEHCSLLMGDVKETLFASKEEGRTEDVTRDKGLLFVRGDGVLTISPFDG